MANIKIVPMKKHEPTDKEVLLAEFLETADALQAFLETAGKGGELWKMFNYLAMYLAERGEERGLYKYFKKGGETDV